MPLNFTVTDFKEYKGLEGEFRIQVRDLEIIPTGVKVPLKVLSPLDYEGQIHTEIFNIYHDNPEVAAIALDKFSKFCFYVGGVAKGKIAQENDLLFKEANVVIKKNKNGYHNVVSWQPINQSKEVSQQKSDPEKLNKMLEACGMGKMPETPKESGITLNDEVPF